MIERNELTLLAERGIQFKDPFDVITLFEEKVAQYMGAPYAVAVDSCTHAIELSLRYLKAKGQIQVPKRTYLSVPMTVLKLNCRVEWTESEWQQSYTLQPYPVIDASLHFQKNSYRAGSFTCLSFHQKKTLPIGRGGMILTSDAQAADWLRKSSYDGRNRNVLWKEDAVETIGYHYYMTPEDAARGLLLLEGIDQLKYKTGGFTDYPDISLLKVFKDHGT